MSELVQFALVKTRINVTFWNELSKRKLDAYGLSDAPVTIWGKYRAGIPYIELDYSSFEEPAPSADYAVAKGLLLNCNTRERFAKADKKKALSDYGASVWADDFTTENSNAPLCGGHPCRFLVLSYSDIKKHEYTYFAAVLALRFKGAEITSPSAALTPATPAETSAVLAAAAAAGAAGAAGCVTLPASDENASGDIFNVWFVDPSDDTTHLGWPARNLLAGLLKQGMWGRRIRLFSIKSPDDVRRADVALPAKIVDTSSPEEEKDNDATPVASGWEVTNPKTGAVKARVVSLAASMDPYTLAETAADLNLKLMRWRMFVDLDLAKIARTKVLLLGSGTLGCNVARCLVGWGVRDITFVDNGRVSYSNPVRQSLFTFEDCAGDGKFKAEAAAESLRHVFPGVRTRSHVFTIPMPGHFVAPAEAPRARADAKLLEDLIVEHDAIFLLSDSRECRWLPTLLGVLHRKLVITVGLGFDSYVVIRHGLPPDNNTNCGERLGCYFCSDVIAPRDSISDRTLDMACTVTRPGISMVASALACELFISILHHPLGALAPAGSQCALGTIPHQLRGFLSQWNLLQLTGEAYSHCVACSKYVVDEYKERGFEFLLEVFNNPSYLEQLSKKKAGACTDNAEDNDDDDDDDDTSGIISIGGDEDDF